MCACQFQHASHIEPLEGRAYIRGQPHLISMQVRLCCGGGKYQREMKYISFWSQCFKQRLLLRQINTLPVGSICNRDMRTPELTANSEAWRGWCSVWWGGSSVSPAVSMQCDCLTSCNSLLLSLSLCLRSKRMRCHGFTGMCMGMWGFKLRDMSIQNTVRKTMILAF